MNGTAMQYGKADLAEHDTATKEDRLMPDAGSAVPAEEAVSEQAMSRGDAAPAEPRADEGQQRRVTELRVSGHIMTLGTGLFCIFHAPGSAIAAPQSGLPGVRVSPAPGQLARAGVDISTFSNDGWLSGRDDAALVRVAQGPADILVTVYQSAGGTDAPPRLQVVQLSNVAGAQTQDAPAAPRGPQAEAPAAGAGKPDVVAHVQRMGDIVGHLGAWVGERGSQRWVEGFAIVPQGDLSNDDIEYQAVLGRGWLSPWSKGGEFCGSRGMALPILGLRVRLVGAAAEAFECNYSATFTDGTAVGPMPAGEAAEAESLAPLEAFQITVRPREGRSARRLVPAATRAEKPAERRPAKAPAKPAAKPPAKPAAPKRRR
jgi:hypothetical protein